MATVDKDTANWRIYGGGGLLVGGVLWLLAIIIGRAAGADAAMAVMWLSIVALVIVAIGFVLLAWGQTGSNGAVGNNMLGKVSLLAAGLGTLIWALVPAFGGTLDGVWGWVVAVLVVLGTILGGVVIMQKGVAKGLARWAMFLVALLAILYFLGAVAGVTALANWVIGLVFAIVVALTGVIYVLNKK